MSRTPSQVEHHYRIERELADRLRHSRPEERTHLYSEVYDELYRRVPEHPMLSHTEQAPKRARNVLRMTQMLSPFLRPEATVMEIGAGDCQLSRAIARRVGRVIGVEVSSGLVAEPLPDNMTLSIIGSPSEIPAPPGSVDLVFSDQVAEHLMPDDFFAQARNVREALRPGGHYVIVTPNRLNGPHDVSMGFDPVATGLHLREYTFTELRDVLLRAGFRKVSGLVGVKGVYLTFPAPLLRTIESVLQALPERFGHWLVRTLLVQQLINVRVLAER